jgi:hypothetical protein
MIKIIKLVICAAMVTSVFGAESQIIIVGGTGENCIEDPGCINRLHPDIPINYRANPGQPFYFALAMLTMCSGLSKCKKQNQKL